MSLAFHPDEPVPPWRVGVFVSSSRRPKHVILVAVGDAEIASYEAHPDFVRWITDGVDVPDGGQP
jgi:hypothetical protein